MGYVASNDIRIFPTSNRSLGPTGTNWVTEHNLASIVANLVDKDKTKGFVISEGPFTGDNDSVIFYLRGYLIETKWGAIKTALPLATETYEGKCSLVLFVNAGGNVVAHLVEDTSTSQVPGAPELETSYYFLKGGDGVEGAGRSSFDLIIANIESGEVPDKSRINFVHLLLDGGVIGADGSIINKGVLNNNNKITGGRLTRVAIGSEGSENSSFTGYIYASTLMGDLNANGKQIDNATYSGTIGTLTGGTITSTAISGSSFAGSLVTKVTNSTTIDNSGGSISGGTLTGATYSGTIGTLSSGTISDTTLSHVTINGTGGASSFTGNIGASTLTDTLTVNEGHSITGTGTVSVATLTGNISNATVTARLVDHASDTKNLAFAFKIDDGTLP